MSSVIPSNSAIAALVHDALNGDEAAKRRLEQLEEDQRRRELVSRKTVDTGRSPVGD